MIYVIGGSVLPDLISPKLLHKIEAEAKQQALPSQSLLILPHAAPPKLDTHPASEDLSAVQGLLAVRHI